MSSLAIVEKKPPFARSGGCAGGVLFHLLDWHRRLARKKRLFSPRRLLPSSLRSSPRKLLTQAPPPPPSPAPATSGAPPGVVARLMGLESWPVSVGVVAAPRPQKQRKVEATSQEGELAMVVVVPPLRRCPPAVAPRSHHGADLPARSPRRSRLVQAAAAKLLEPSARASSRASARLALAYASSSPQRHKDGHSGALQSSGMPDDFLSRSCSLSLERLARAELVAVQPPVLPVHAARDNALSSHRHKKHNNDAGVKGGSRVTRVVVPTTSNGNGKNPNGGGSDVYVRPKGHQERTVGMNNCVTTVDERLLRKRATPTRPEVVGGFGSRSLVSSIPQAGCARELVPASRRVAQNGSCPRQESIGLVNAPGGAHRDMIYRSGVASTSKRMTSDESGPRREWRKKVGSGAAVSDRKNGNTVAFASSSSMRPIARTPSHKKLLEKSGCRSTSSDSARVRTPVVDAKCVEASPSDVATSERDEFSRLLETKIKELGLFDRNGLASSDAPSGKLTASVLQELISALTNDMNTPTSQIGSYSDASAPFNDDETVGCIAQSGYAVSNNQSPELHKYGTVGCVDRLGYALSNDQSTELHKYHQGEQEVNSSAICVNNEGNQPSPTSILEACFSNDTSSLGSPTEKSEGKDLFVSMENKMEDLFNLEIDIVDLAMSIDAAKADAKEVCHDSGTTSCVHNFAAHDFKFLETRLYSIREAISNAELLLGSSPLHSANEASSQALHSVIIEILETIVDVFGGSEQSLGFTEEKQKCQLTNFLFDCIVESLNLKFCNFGKCGYKTWLRLPLALSKELLKREVYEEIRCWGEMRGTAPNQFAEEELNRVTDKWDGCQVEAFEISIAIEKDILDTLVDEFTFGYR